MTYARCTGAIGRAPANGQPRACQRESLARLPASRSNGWGRLW
jgi:hypothetical protein